MVVKVQISAGLARDIHTQADNWLSPEAALRDFRAERGDKVESAQLQFSGESVSGSCVEPAECFLAVLPPPLAPASQRAPPPPPAAGTAAGRPPLLAAVAARTQAGPRPIPAQSRSTRMSTSPTSTFTRRLATSSARSCVSSRSEAWPCPMQFQASSKHFLIDWPQSSRSRSSPACGADVAKMSPDGTWGGGKSPQISAKRKRPPAMLPVASRSRS
mmetsp:Transcript_66889/g.150279  ORF Transcript_66889/g.150279 Transcript_66889/m.150279 type:complete len:216 (-) Transcript_66889:1652-2299(-)